MKAALLTSLRAKAEKCRVRVVAQLSADIEITVVSGRDALAYG
jgi:hypothetical protein